MKTGNARLVAGVLAAAAASGVAGVAGAATLKLTFDNVSPYKAIQLNYNSGRTFDQGPGGSFGTYHSGRMLWHDNYGRSLTTYCTQLTEYINYGQTVNYTIADVASVPDPTPGAMGATRAALVRDLYQRHYFQVLASNDATLNSAFQLAIWEITHENITALDAAGALAQLNVYSGALALNGGDATTQSVGNLAQTLLASLGEDGFRSLGNGLFGLTDASAQDQLVVVPLPVTAALAGLGLIGVVGLRRRIR